MLNMNFSQHDRSASKFYDHHKMRGKAYPQVKGDTCKNVWNCHGGKSATILPKIWDFYLEAYL